MPLMLPMLFQICQLLLFAPVLRHAMIVEAAHRAVRRTDGDRDADANLNAKDIMRRPRELGILATLPCRSR